MRTLVSFLPALLCGAMMVGCMLLMRGGSKRSCCEHDEHESHQPSVTHEPDLTNASKD
ncbi:MAG: hypothetical protein WD004_03585 [Actinomycetota bacterium]